MPIYLRLFTQREREKWALAYHIHMHICMLLHEWV